MPLKYMDGISTRNFILTIKDPLMKLIETKIWLGYYQNNQNILFGEAQLKVGWLHFQILQNSNFSF